MITIIFLFYLAGAVCEENIAYLSDDFKCSLPDITSQNEYLDITRMKSDFSKISEVKFPGLIGPLNEKLICKIKCIDGNWVGPLCSSTPDGRFQPILRDCIYDNEHAMLIITFKNSSIDAVTNFPHGSKIEARCRFFGYYKIKGEDKIRCENGEWVPEFPQCIPTSVITNFTGDSPPTIQYNVISGSAVVHTSGELFVYPESTVQLNCISPRVAGEPEWSWTQALGNHNTAWSSDEREKETHYQLMLNKMSARHSGQYTCTTPSGYTNTITIKVVSVTCPPINVSSPKLRHYTQGSQLGHSALFSCQQGYHLNGSAVITCMGDGRWSSLAPTCVKTLCPFLNNLEPHLSIVEYNSSFGGRAIFQCAWGYRLVGAPALECELNGTWSGETPHCVPVYCPDPVIPNGGVILTKDSSKDNKYPVGEMLIYSCKEGFKILGESSIVCTENGFWSHPPPFCLQYSELRGTDTIYVDNTTLVHFEDSNISK